MSLGYPYQQTFVAVGSKVGTARTAVSLTNAYDVANKTKIFETGGITKANLSILYTTAAGSANDSIELRVRTSVDGTNFYRIPNESVSAGTSTLTQREFTFVGVSGTTAYSLSLPLDVQDEYMELSCKNTAGTTNGTVFVEITLSGEK